MARHFLFHKKLTSSTTNSTTDERESLPHTGIKNESNAKASLSVQQQQTDPSISPHHAQIETDALGIAPVFFTVQKDGRIEATGSEARDVAALGADLSLDPVAMYEDIVLGFRVGDRSLFQGVTRLSPDSILKREDAEFVILPQQHTDQRTIDPAEALSTLAARTAILAADGAMIELTGGVDSRVVLALALAGGCAPKLALTLGGPESPDVIAGRALAKRFGIEQVIIEPDSTPDDIFNDAADFARASGYACSSASYAWLPNIFRQIEPRRSTQLSGVGGERAGGFYYTPLDRFSSLPLFTRTWMKYRLLTPGIDASLIFKPSILPSLHKHAMQDAKVALGDPHTPWRSRVDGLYEHQRLRQWAGASFRAATHWYHVEAPMLWPEFTPWIQQVAQPTGNPRQALIVLIGKLCPELASMPYANDFRSSAAPPRREAKALRLAKKVARRLTRTRKMSDLGASRATQALVANDQMRSYIDHLLELRTDIFNNKAIRSMLNTPQDFAHELGFLFTWSLAQHDLENHTHEQIGTDTRTTLTDS